MDDGNAGQSQLGRAEKGQKVEVVLDHIKADKREQFERFLDLFWRNLDAWPAEDQQIHDNTRLLSPNKANADGTYTYAWLLDPFIEGANYRIRTLLQKMYGEEKAAEYFHLWVDTWASERVEYMLVQT
jgi:hypothetical protein